MPVVSVALLTGGGGRLYVRPPLGLLGGFSVRLWHTATHFEFSLYTDSVEEHTEFPLSLKCALRQVLRMNNRDESNFYSHSSIPRK